MAPVPLGERRVCPGILRPGKASRARVIDVFNALGESLALVTVRASDIEALRADEVFAVRPLARAI
jgi:hypothetical protein